jgi:lipopolysaccharide transport system permease protein
MGLGVGIFVSSMTTKYRDLAMLVGFGVQLWMYGTPIVYPLSTLGPGPMRTALLINPVTMPVEIYRYALLGVGTIIPEYVVLSCAFTLLMIALGVIVYNHVERTFMDTV